MTRTQRMIERISPSAPKEKWPSVREAEYWFYKSILDTPPEFAHNLRRARMDAYVLDHYSVVIDPDELLAGKMSCGFRLAPEMEADLARGKDIYQHAQGGLTQADTHHRVIDYEKLLSTGISGVLAEIDGKLADIDFSRPDHARQYAFYAACKISLEAVCRFAGRYRERLDRLCTEEADPVRREEYRVMAVNLRAVPSGPAANFYQAVQSMWFVQFCLRLLVDISLTGRPDQYLWPYYQADIESGAMTGEFAFSLIEELFIKHNEIYYNWPASLMVGGVDRRGDRVWNSISDMCLDAIETTGLVNPSVAVCYTSDTPDAVLERCVDLVAKGYTKPSIFNDRVIQKGLRAAGAGAEDSRYYVHSTCVEITPIASSNILVTAPYINLTKVFEYIFNDKQKIFGDDCVVAEDVEFSLDGLADFSSFLALAKKVVSAVIRTHLINTTKTAYTRAHYQASPLASAFLDDCLERGLDAGEGGARYNYAYPCFPGFTNLVDALAAVRQAVYEEHVLTLPQMSDLLRQDFEDNERMRQYLVQRCPKFGNDNDSADELAAEMYDFLRDEMQKYILCTGGTFHPGYFAWIKHGEMGGKTAATPDGRHQGTALSECMGAAQGLDKEGPAAVMRSIQKLDQSVGIGGIATNFRFSRGFVDGPQGRAAVRDFIRTFMDADCFEIQFNVVDQDDLKQAQLRPEDYQSLLVRVAGYSDYFVRLSPEIQNEIISRTEHGAT